jgi:hypothetical protein
MFFFLNNRFNAYINVPFPSKSFLPLYNERTFLKKQKKNSILKKKKLSYMRVYARASHQLMYIPFFF